MRHTLLPLQEKIVLRKEYRIRAAIVFLLLLSVSGLIGIIALFPSFILASSEEKIATREVASLKIGDKNTGANSSEDNTAILESLITSLNEEVFRTKVSDVVNGVVGMKESLRLTSIAVSRTSTSTVTSTIQGIAPTRNSLLSFKNDFESATLGNKVDMPVSQLGKSSNIDFSLQLTQKLP